MSGCAGMPPFKRNPKNPPAKNGCTCYCHRSFAIVKHFRACCPREPRKPVTNAQRIKKK